MVGATGGSRLGEHAVYPGTFDPLTPGHLDIIERARHLFSRVTVLVAVNADKRPTGTPSARAARVRRQLPANWDNLSVAAWAGLTAEFCRHNGADVIIRGVRNRSDLSQEYRLAAMNEAMGIRTLLLPARPRMAAVSSTMLRGGGVARPDRGRVRRSVFATRAEESSSVTSIPDIRLNNGQTIPQFGFGVFQIEPKDTVTAVSTALEAGYRHIDTAEGYGNEAEVGEAIARSGLDRGEVFVTSKLGNDAHEPDDARQAFDGTLKALGTEYVDLFLIHWPLPTRYGGDFVQTWRTLEEFYREGRARSIGVSNFQPHHLRRLHGETDIIPAVNQIEVHPYLTQDEVRAFCAEHQIAIEGWSPLGRGGVLDDPAIRSIAERTGKTPAQVVLRWHIQRGDIVFPKSVTPDRIRENIDIFDFELSAADVEDITLLNKNERTGPDPDKFAGM